MMDNIKPNEAATIINSLIAGAVPKIGTQHILVGRKEEIEAFLETINDVKDGQSSVKFWIGDYGSGKSFMLHVLKMVALQQKFVIADADFGDEVRLSDNSRRAQRLYSAIINSLSIQTKPQGGALATLLEKWIEHMIKKFADENHISAHEAQSDQYLPSVKMLIKNTINEFTENSAFYFGDVIYKYYEGYFNNDSQLKRNALKWLKGEYLTKTEARQELGIREIINDQNYFDMLKNFCQLFVYIGYSGFMINLDETVNLYKISDSRLRERNYEKMLSIYNDCLQGRISHLLINFTATTRVLEDERRGIFSYQALKSRLEIKKSPIKTIVFGQPAIYLRPLDQNQLFVLLQRLKSIFDYNYQVDLPMSDQDIKEFINDMYNKPGAAEFLTPREVIRQFLNILSILRLNPHLDKRKLFRDLDINDERSDEGSGDKNDGGGNNIVEI